MLMVKAGPAVDALIEQLMPLLSPGDVIIDGGNTHFSDTERRTNYVESKGLLYVGTGVSGGEEGALLRPQHDARRQPGRLAAGQADLSGDRRQGRAEPRHPLLRMGRPARRGALREDGAQRHRVWRHAVDLRSLLPAQAVLGLSNDELYDVFAAWNRGELDSYLIEITRDIFSVKDDETGDYPGRHDSRHGRRQGNRQMDEPIGARSGRAEHAGHRGRLCPLPLGAQGGAACGPAACSRPDGRAVSAATGRQFIDAVRQALYASKICSYAQGFVQMQPRRPKSTTGRSTMATSRCCGAEAASSGRDSSNGSKRPSTPIRKLENLLLAPYFTAAIQEAQDAWRHVVATAVELGIPVPAFTTALTYYDGFRASGCPPICCKRSAIISVRTPIDGSTSPARITAIGCGCGGRYGWIDGTMRLRIFAPILGCEKCDC